jgi:hypothetical protein
LDNFFQLVAASLVQCIDIFNGNRGIFAHADWVCWLEGASGNRLASAKSVEANGGIPLIQGLLSIHGLPSTRSCVKGAPVDCY